MTPLTLAGLALLIVGLGVAAFVVIVAILELVDHYDLDLPSSVRQHERAQQALRKATTTTRKETP